MKLCCVLLFAIPCATAYGSAPHVALRNGRDVDTTRHDVLAASAKSEPPTYFILDPRGKIGRIIMVTFFGVSLLLLYGMAWASQRVEKGHGEDHMHRSPVALPADIYGFSVASVCYDTRHLVSGTGSAPLRRSRLISSIGLVVLNLAVQAIVVGMVASFVTPKWVHDIRADYDEYEQHMYPQGHTTITVNGNHRGIPGYIQDENFETLDEDLKARVCNIPFSQPGFFLLLVFAWTLTCMGEFRHCAVLFETALITTPTISSMSDCMEQEDEFDNVVIGLTRGVKALIIGLFVLPRAVMTSILLFLGCRFLAATTDFGELLLNAVALEFLLLVKDLLYNSVVSDRNKREVENIYMLPAMRKEAASYWTYFGSFLWAFLALAWTLTYMYCMQSVLPEYRWDVRPFCDGWLQDRYSSKIPKELESMRTHASRHAS